LPCLLFCPLDGERYYHIGLPASCASNRCHRLLRGNVICHAEARRALPAPLSPERRLMAMSDAIESGLGRRYRLVTLDDASFVPLEVPPLERWSYRLGSYIPVISLLDALVAVSWLGTTLFTFIRLVSVVKV